MLMSASVTLRASACPAASELCETRIILQSSHQPPSVWASAPSSGRKTSATAKQDPVEAEAEGTLLLLRARGSFSTLFLSGGGGGRSSRSRSHPLALHSQFLKKAAAANAERSLLQMIKQQPCNFFPFVFIVPSSRLSCDQQSNAINNVKYRQGERRWTHFELMLLETALWAAPAAGSAAAFPLLSSLVSAPPPENALFTCNRAATASEINSGAPRRAAAL
jgi:hypothetical protein